MSTNGVKYLFSAAEKLKQTKQLHEGLQKSFVIAVGPRTAEAMKEYDVRVDLVPQKYSRKAYSKPSKAKISRAKKFAFHEPAMPPQP